MWLIPTRQRPHRLLNLIKACQKTKMSTSAVLLIDDDDPCLSSYLNLGWPVETGPHGGLSEIYNRAFEHHPDEEWYGILCDDAVPKTEYFDLKLIKVAGKKGLAAPSGGHSEIASHFVIGGDLVRNMGWVALPGLDRLYIDTVWYKIALATGVYHFVPEVVIEHHHFSNGKALMDATYRKANKGRDRDIYENWLSNLT